ncbi:MAG: aminopeptidase P family protein [Deltaproteobacteria bacterium]|nr:aminopeptidase P family protein [Deltaproteobacteria bacterium]
MDYAEWVREELEMLLRSHGLEFVPREELDARLRRLRPLMKDRGMDALLIIQKMDCYYFSGTAQDALLYVPLDDEPLLMVRRELGRAGIESALTDIVEMRSIREISGLIGAHRGLLPKNLGMELDMLPAKEYLRYGELFPKTRIVDGSRVIAEVRKIKSPYEIERIRKAGRIGQRVYEEGRNILREGMSEIEFGGLLEACAKKYGHEGLIRVRAVNYEAYTWHVLSGPSGGIVSQSDSPMGGVGLSPAFPVGASRRRMGPGEPILVDFGTCYQGYQSDETRMFSIGRMEDKFLRAYDACRKIHDAVLDRTRPGADCEALFEDTLGIAEELGYAKSYLGPAGLQTRFIAHGIGLELAELPYLARGHSYPLEEGMVFALEPKIVFPGEGAVGVENTVLVTAEGFEILTPLRQDILEV